MNINTLFKCFIILAVTAVFSSCRTDGPTVPVYKASIVKSETKWSCDLKTGTNSIKVNYKEYDKEGNIIKSIDYFPETGNVSTETDYRYGSNNSIEERTYFNNAGIADSVKINSYIFDETGKVSLKLSLDTKGDTLGIAKYAYDTKGNIVNKKELTPSGTIVNETNYAYSYNQSGEIVEKITNPNINGSYQSRDTLIYRTGEKQVDRVNYNSTGSIQTKFTYYYNSKGTLIKEVESDNNGTPIIVYAYEYQYY